MDVTGNDYAYLNIPYFTSQSKLKQEISNFLVAIINLNAFIFLMAVSLHCLLRTGSRIPLLLSVIK